MNQAIMSSQYQLDGRGEGFEEEAKPYLHNRPPSRRRVSPGPKITRGEDEDVSLNIQPSLPGRTSARTYRTINPININAALISGTSSPRPPTSSVVTRTHLSTGLMRTDKDAKGSLVIKAMKEKLASQRGGIKVGNVRTATSRGQVNRIVQDKRYYMASLHLKIGELSDEIDRLNRLYKEAVIEHDNSIVYEKRVKELASEITEMQGSLIDLNIVADNLTFDNVHGIKNQTRELKENNDSLTERIENIFSDRLRKEEAVLEVEKKLNQERKRNEKLLSELGPEMKEMNSTLLKNHKKVEQWQQEIEALNKKKASLNEHVYMYPLIYEVIRLESKLISLRKKWASIKKKPPKRSSDEERKSIMDLVVSDNSQIAIMESAITEINKEIKNAEEVLAMTKEPEEGRDNRQIMYKELLKKEEALENYLSNFEILKQGLNIKLSSMEDDLIRTLDILSKKLSLVPTPADFLYLQFSFLEKDDALLNTVKSVGTKCENLRKYYAKVEIMQNKLQEDFDTIESKIKTINEEMAEYDSCTKLSNRIEENQNKLLKIKNDLEMNRQLVKDGLQTAKSLHDELMKQLNENEHQLQIFSLEKKLSNIAQNNFSMSELIEEINISPTVKNYREQTLDVLQNLNMFLRNNINY